MDIEEALSDKDFNQDKFKAFVKIRGLDKLTVKELNRFIKKYGIDVFNNVRFDTVFNHVTTDKTNRTMRRWTIAIGLMTAVMMVVAILGYIN